MVIEQTLPKKMKTEPKKSATAQLNIIIPVELKRELKAAAAMSGKKLAELAAEIIESYTKTRKTGGRTITLPR